MATKEEIMDSIKGMSVLELSDLVKTLEDEFGITAAAPVAVAAAPAAADGAAFAEEAQSEFEVTLQSFCQSKINVIKAVRDVTSLGLREATELVESAPVRVTAGVPQAAADSVKATLAAAGAPAGSQ